MMKNKYLILLFLVIASAFIFMPIVAHAAPTLPGGTTPLTTTLLQHDKPWVENLFRISKGLLNITLLIGLLLASFATILKLDIDSYTIKKILPRIIVAAVLGNLIMTVAGAGSMIIDKLMQISFFRFNSWDIASILGLNAFDTLKTALYAITSGGRAAAAGITGSSSPLGTIVGVATAPAKILAGTVGGALAVGPILTIGIIANFLVLVVIIAVTFMMALRPSIVLFAVALGPIAMGLSVLPFAEPLFKKWYKILIFWIFYPLIANFLIYVIRLIPH